MRSEHGKNYSCLLYVEKMFIIHGHRHPGECLVPCGTQGVLAVHCMGAGQCCTSCLWPQRRGHSCQMLQNAITSSAAPQWWVKVDGHTAAKELRSSGSHSPATSTQLSQNYSPRASYRQKIPPRNGLAFPGFWERQATPELVYAIWEKPLGAQGEGWLCSCRDPQWKPQKELKRTNWGIILP